MPATTAIGRYSIAPAAALATVGPRRAARWRGKHDPGRAGGLGRAHDRAEVPRVGDAVDATRNASGAASSSSSRPSATGAASATTPCGASVRARSSSCAAPTRRTAAPSARPRERFDARLALLPPTSHTSRTARRRAAQQLAHRAAPSTCSPPRSRSGRRPCRARGHAHRCQMVPLGVSSSLMPRPASSSRMRSAVGEVACGARLVAAAHERVDLGVVVRSSTRRRRPRARATPSSSRTARAATRRVGGVAGVERGVRAAHGVEDDRDRGRRVEVVVHRGAERRRRVAGSARRRGHAARRAARGTSASSRSTPSAAAPSSCRPSSICAAVVRLQHREPERARRRSGRARRRAW